MPTSSQSVTVADLLANAAWTRRLARSLTTDAATADDLVQETWIRKMVDGMVVGQDIYFKMAPARAPTAWVS